MTLSKPTTLTKAVGSSPGSSWKAATLPRQLKSVESHIGSYESEWKTASLPRQPRSVGSGLDKYSSHHGSHGYGLAPVRPPPSFARCTSPHSHTLDQLRHDLKGRVRGDHHITPAWTSQPNSRVGSRNPSRAGTRNPSAVLTQDLPAGQHYKHLGEQGSSVEDVEELQFHPVECYSTKADGIASKSSSGKPNIFFLKCDSPETESPQDITLPSIAPTPAKSQKKAAEKSSGLQSYLHRNGVIPQSHDFEMKTDLSANVILGEILKAMKSLNVREASSIGHNRLTCVWKGVRLTISVSKDSYSKLCRLSFQWQSEVDQDMYLSIRDQIIAKIVL